MKLVKHVQLATIRVNAFDASVTVLESCVMSFIVGRPASEPGFYLDRSEGAGRFKSLTAIKSYSVQANAEGSRY